MASETPTTQVLQIPLVATKAEEKNKDLSLESLLWLVFILVVFFIFLRRLKRLVDCLIHRIENGGALEAGFLKLSELRVTQDSTVLGSSIQSFPDESRNEMRDREYEENRRVFLAHKLFPSNAPNQLYDILIFLVPHHTDLNGIKKVEYFFGKSWNSNVFVSEDRGKRFGILASAHGSGFLCLAKVYPSTGEPFFTSRYIDFEAGNIGKG